MSDQGNALEREATMYARSYDEMQVELERLQELLADAVDMIGAGLMWASFHPAFPYRSTAKYPDSSGYGRARKVMAALRAEIARLAGLTVPEG